MNLINIHFGSAPSAPVPLIETVLPGLTIALVAGIILFGLNWFREWVTAWSKRNTEAGVLAFSLASEIDRLIAGCAEVVDDPFHTDQTTGISETTVKSPWIDLPDGWNWGSFPKKLQYRIRSIPNKIDLANRSVASFYEYGDGPPDYYDAFEERTFRFSEIGLEAIEINDLLVRDYNVPLLDRGLWNPRERFGSLMAAISARRADREASPPPMPYWLHALTPIEVLNARYAKLTRELAAAIDRRKVGY